MGRRSATETLGAIYQCFLRQRTWSQAALAREVDVSVPALRRQLEELARRGMPIERDEDHPHVFWSVPREWFPGGVAFDAEEAAELLALLARLPRSDGADKFMDRILQAAPAPHAGGQIDPREVVLPPSASEMEETWLPVTGEAASRRVALHLRYFSASRGAVEWRHVSVQRVLVGPPARLVAVCHRDGNLKWFRLDNVISAKLDESEPHRAAERAAIDVFLKQSLDGFHHGARPVRAIFFVRAPESRWVERNLPGEMEAETLQGGLRFSVTTSAPIRLARFVVGLGAAAKAESLELARLVEELAQGACAATEEGVQLVLGERSDTEEGTAPPRRSQRAFDM